ncbi:MAG: ATP-binding protein [Gammaproteobacteria bacterium]
MRWSSDAIQLFTKAPCSSANSNISERWRPERLDARKEERGRLSVAATVAGDRLQAQIEDDGRGIDPDRIREVALGRRLISESDIAMHDDKAAIDLVFDPGFTTVARIREISGRGVGLDIVRTSIQELGGDVGIRSGAGRGTHSWSRCRSRARG